MSVVIGCDIGSVTGKTVILNGGDIISSSIVKSKPLPVQTVNETFGQALEKAGMDLKDVEYMVGTGYGRVKIPSVNKTVTEIACHAKGAASLIETIETLVDIGGQDCKVIQLDKHRKGSVVSFVMNDKCAAGTGRFLEIMAMVFEMETKDIGPLAIKANRVVPISSQCSVFAESEVISLIAEEIDRNDILAGVCDSVAGRIQALIGRVGLRGDVAISGGVAKNIGVVKMLEDRIERKIKKLPGDPQIVGALGAAIIAQESLQKLTAGGS